MIKAQYLGNLLCWVIFKKWIILCSVSNLFSHLPSDSNIISTENVCHLGIVFLKYSNICFIFPCLVLLQCEESLKGALISSTMLSGWQATIFSNWFFFNFEKIFLIFLLEKDLRKDCFSLPLSSRNIFKRTPWDLIY